MGRAELGWAELGRAGLCRAGHATLCSSSSLLLASFAPLQLLLLSRPLIRCCCGRWSLLLTLTPTLPPRSITEFLSLSSTDSHRSWIHSRC